ncbi:MAG: EamA family transporter RarD [Rhodospirillales bacterium]|nr:EamA family transporter RarD [Rhodospirillales bacterium]
MPNNNKDQGLIGAAAALTAFSLWGIYPLYFKALSDVAAFEVLAHRILWTVIFLGMFIMFSGRGHHVRAVLKDKKLLATLLLSSLLVSLNWLVFIWAVGHDMVLQTSLGYFINPLVSVALGMIFLKERLRLWQWLAVGMSMGGVANLIGQLGSLPWVALTVAISFGLYGLIRKVAVVDAFTGLFIETGLLLPPILIYLITISFQGSGAFGMSDIKLDGLLMVSGLMTAAPLVLFAFAAKRLRLSSLGFFQYIAPTGHFLLAVFLFNEPFTDAHKITFGMIWLALAIYTIDSIIAHRKA